MQSKHKVRFSIFAALVALASITAGCGSGSGSSNVPSNAATSPVQVSLGDAPADWILAFSMNVNSITMKDNSGHTVNVLTSATPMEMISQMGTVQPLKMVNIPQGTYTQATVNISPVSMGYMDPSTHQYVKKSLSGTYSGTVTFNPPMTVGSGSSVMSFDMDMANSVSINSSGNVTITPTFTAMMNPTATSTQSAWQGYMQNMVGSISSSNGTQFTMTMLTGQQSVTVTTNNSTQFQGMGGMGGMSNGMIVSVDATTQPDGSLLAQKVSSLENSGGMMAGGFIGNITGTPATGFTMATNSGIGGGMMMSNIASTMTVNISTGTTCSIDAPPNLDLAAFTFANNFSTNCATAIAKGQMIDVVSSSGMMGGGMGGGMMGGSTSNSIDATELKLEQQGMHGTVSNYSGSSFTLTMPSDSALGSMTGPVIVYVQPGTQMLNTPLLGNGSNVEVRGLMFDDAGTYKMVAAWIVTPTT